METSMMYIIKSALLLALFWGIYRLCLRGETFYKFNRFFLITGIILSLTMPLVTIYFPVEVTAPEIPVTLTATTSAPLVTDAVVTPLIPPAHTTNWLLLTYLAGIGILLLFRSRGLMQLFAVVQRYGYKNIYGYKLVESPAFGSAFSFFRLVFMPQVITSERERELILKHESAHISQYHWLDLLLADLLCIFQWFNPMVWLYSQSVRENHEFLADNAVIQTVNKAYYQKILVSQWCKIPVFPVANSFCYSSQLKRINMMKKNISNPVKKTFALLTVPALALFLWAFAEPEYTTVCTTTGNPEDINTGITANSGNNANLTDTVYYKKGDVLKQIDDKKEKRNKKDNAGNVNNEKKDSLPEKTESLSAGLKDVTFPSKQMLVVIDGTPSDKKLNQLEAKDIYSMSIVKGNQFVANYGKEAENGVILITTKAISRDTLLATNGIDIKGLVTDEDGKPLQDARIILHPNKPIGASDKVGKFAQRILQGDFIFISHPGYLDEFLSLKPAPENDEYVVKLKKITPGMEITVSSTQTIQYPKADLRKISDFLHIIVGKTLKEKGVAIMDYTIDTAGNFSDLKLTIQEGDEAFKTALETALKDFPKLTPPTKDGIPIKLRFKNSVIRIPSDSGPFGKGTSTGVQLSIQKNGLKTLSYNKFQLTKDGYTVF